nr:hypothetical protein [Tanacetum cinerariifolium]
MNYSDDIRYVEAAPYELLYGQKCRAPICWNEIGERVIKGPELIEVTNEKVDVAKENIKEASSRQKIYDDRHRRGYKCHPLHVVSYPLDQIREDLSLAEEPEKILDRQERVMRNKTIPFVKIRWKNHPEREATWETKESMRGSVWMHPRLSVSFSFVLVNRWYTSLVNWNWDEVILIPSDDDETNLNELIALPVEYSDVEIALHHNPFFNPKLFNSAESPEKVVATAELPELAAAYTELLIEADDGNSFERNCSSPQKKKKQAADN